MAQPETPLSAKRIEFNQFLYRHPNAMNYSRWIGVGYYVAMITALCGWGVLAFSRKKGEKPDA